MIEIRPATAELLKQYYGDMPPRTVRAIVAIDDDGEVLGVGGYYIEGVRAMVFSDIKPEMRDHKRALIMGTRAAIDLARSSGLTAIAIRETPESASFLEHFGFREFMPGIYEWLS
jgi:N-acetylglutamate synthase-like GNAT family acetyltransferase